MRGTLQPARRTTTWSSARRAVVLVALAALLAGCADSASSQAPGGTTTAASAAVGSGDAATPGASPATSSPDATASSGPAAGEPSPTPSAPPAPAVTDPSAIGDPTWETMASLPKARMATHALTLASGAVLVVGNEGLQSAFSGARLDSRAATTWSPKRDAWKAAAGLKAPRSMFGAVVLRDGRVLVAGGLNAGDGCEQGGNQSYSSAYTFDPGADAWTKTGLMTAARTAPAIALLPDGRVLVAGGYYRDRTTGLKPGADTAIDPHGAPPAQLAAVRNTGPTPAPALGDVTPEPVAHALATAEVYDPRTGEWSKTAAMRYPRYAADAVVLADGRILVAGSGPGEEDGVAGLPADAPRTAEIYDPKSGRWSMAGQFPVIDLAALRIDGKPAWVALQDPAPVTNGRLVALHDGGALLVGNAWWWKHEGDLDRVLRFDVTTSTWTTVGVPWFTTWTNEDPGETYSSPGRSTDQAAVAVLEDGRVLVAGGDNIGQESGRPQKRRNASLFDPVTSTWTRLPDMPGPKSGAAATLLRDGSVLLVGGFPSADSVWATECGKPAGMDSVYRFIP